MRKRNIVNLNIYNLNRRNQW